MWDTHLLEGLGSDSNDDVNGLPESISTREIHPSELDQSTFRTTKTATVPLASIPAPHVDS